MIPFAVFGAEASVTGYAKRNLEKTSMAVMTFSFPPQGGKFGKKSIRIAISGPKVPFGQIDQFRGNGRVRDSFVFFADFTSLIPFSNTFCDAWIVVFSSNFDEHFGYSWVY